MKYFPKMKLKDKMQNAKKWLKENMHTNVKQLIDKLNQKLEGHYRYYGITGNSIHMEKFRNYVIHQLYKVLNRRSQRNKYSWERFKEKILDRFPIKCTKIYVNLYSRA